MVRELTRPVITPPVYISSTWISIKNNLDIDIERVIQYYRVKNGTVKNTSLLTRIIDSVDVMVNRDISNAEYLYKLKPTIGGIERTFKIAGLFHYGDFQDDNINGNNNVYISRTLTYIPTDEISILDIPSIGVLNHDVKDLSLEHPINYNNGDTIIYYIDIGLMLLQYRTWLESRTFKQPTDSATFIHDIVLTNTIRGYFSISMRNIVFSGGDGIVSEINNSILVSNHTHRVVKSCMDVRKYIYSKNLNMRKALDYIPSVSNLTYYRYLTFTRQLFNNGYSKPTTYYLFLRLFTLFFTDSTDRTKRKNKTMISTLKRKLKIFANSQGLMKTNVRLKYTILSDILYIEEEL